MITEFLVLRLQETRSLRRSRLGGRITRKEVHIRVWAGVIWLRRGADAMLFEEGQKLSGFK
jgi:hypothetical protein